MSSLKLYIIAGEASGDLHGSNLVKALKRQKNDLQVRAWGGEMMDAAGAEIVKHYRDLAFMGFIEVVMNLRTILKNIAFCKGDISAYRPDAVVLIDYPGFNLRIASYCKELGIPVLYYISPQIWAWKENRIHRIKRDVSQMYVILPFEKDFYAKHGMDVSFVGHPLLDVIQPERAPSTSIRAELGIPPSRRIIALLPGSRKQEISTMLPVMLRAVEQFDDCTAVVAGAPGQDEEFYRSFAGMDKHHLVFGKTYALFEEAAAGLVTSGTATLEGALHMMPLVVCYKGSSISYAIAKRLVKIKYISLVNLILDREAVRELIQHEMKFEVLHSELDRLLNDDAYRQAQTKAFTEMRMLLGGPGASERTAKEMLKTLGRSSDAEA